MRKARGWHLLAHPCGGRQEHLVRLDGHEPGHDADERRVTEAEFRAQLAPPALGHQQRRQVEAERHGAVLRRGADAERDELVGTRDVTASRRSVRRARPRSMAR